MSSNLSFCIAFQVNLCSIINIAVLGGSGDLLIIADINSLDANDYLGG